MMKYDLFWWIILQGRYCCAGRMLISLSSKCWIPLNINHWTAELINQTNVHTCLRLCVFLLLLVFFQEGQHLAFYWSPYREVCSLSVCDAFACRLTGNEPLSILPLNSLPEENVGRAHYKLCDRLKLEKKQRRMCRRDPGVAETLREAITMSALECQYQFRFERWNCTIEGRHRSNILKRGTRFVAFSLPLG